MRGAVQRYRIVGIRDLRANLHGGGIAHAVVEAAVGERPATLKGKHLYLVRAVLCVLCDLRV